MTSFCLFSELCIKANDRECFKSSFFHSTLLETFVHVGVGVSLISLLYKFHDVIIYQYTVNETWVISHLGLLWIMSLQISLPMSLGAHVHAFNIGQKPQNGMVKSRKCE